MAFDPALDKISINELNEDLQKKINANYDQTEGLREDLDKHIADKPNPDDPDFETSRAAHVIQAEREYWNKIEENVNDYVRGKLGNLQYDTVADGFADKVSIVNFNRLVGSDWEKREDRTLTDLAFSGKWKDIYDAPALDDDGNIKYAKSCKIAETANNALNADTASVAATANFATTAEKAYNSFMVNNSMLVVLDIAPTTSYIEELIKNTSIAVTTVIWVDVTKNKIKICLNFMSYTDADRPWIPLG